MDIKYTIIIPHYNTPLLLKRCCMSIPEREDIQVVIIDDCSPDAKKYLQEYSYLKRKNVEFYINDTNKGGGYARNIGLKFAKGRWLLFADADDYFVNGFEKILDEYYNSEADIIYFNIESVYSDNIQQKANRNMGKELLFNNFKKTNDSSPFRYLYCEPWAKLIKHHFVNNNNLKFDETKVANDYYFSVTTGCLANKIDIIDKKIYVLTLRKGSVSAEFGDTLEKILTRLWVYTRVQLFMEKNGYIIEPMRIRGIMVLLLKKNFIEFVKQLYIIHKKGISVTKLLYQMFNIKYMN